MGSCSSKLDSGAAHWIASAIGVVRQHVRDVRICLPAGHSTQPGGRAWAVRLAQELRVCGRYVSERHRMETVAIVAPQNAESGLAETYSLIQHCVEHWCEFAGRGVDDLQYLSGRGLLLQCLAGFSDQPRVFHRNDRLRREI